ncbi:VWA domain-containing protein [Tichowtungia aerotolerans]|uniref:VWA domain-containing protein n=1 Tax=Tichowtungia aerotolerans TaxID=2697043 RepID=A0A6P1M8A2_9BACT|nr:VWA domain-containing protein [Tichowtungia aerotolerans]QHI70101.1 VWA domain-containing protein [Tichowtungia aerotolerans]
MRFANPYLLLLLLIVPLLLWWRGRRRRGSINFPDSALLLQLPVSLTVRLQPLFPILYTAGLVCLIVALARPQRGLQESRVNTEGVDIVLLLDLSTSMDTPDFAHNGQRVTRIDSAKAVIADFIQKRPDDRIGMVAFSALPYSVAPLTLDHSWLIQRMDGLRTGMLEDGTAIGDALASAVNRLRDSEAKSRIVVLVTDGENNRGELTPENAAQAAAALGIKIYTIGIGGGLPVRQGFFTQAPQQLDTTVLEQVADISKGRFFRAMDLNELKKVYDTIDQLEKTEIEMQQFTRYEETAQSWLIAAVLFLTLEKLLSLTRFGRLPE